MRRKTRNFQLGNTGIGSDFPVTVQSMCNTPTANAAATLAQINELAAAGCDIIRVSADKPEDITALYGITEASPIPVIADIQFASEMAVKSLDAGCAAIRINPGIVRDPELLPPIAAKLLEKNAVIRVGANAGSLPPHEIKRRIASGMDHADAIADALCDAALSQCRELEKLSVRNIKVALKCSDVQISVKACRRFAAMTDYPLHLGLTEAGTPRRGIVKSAATLGGLLLDGIGDTIRISLTAPPLQEIYAAQQILEACGIRQAAPEIVSCPTCGRTEIDLIALADKVEEIVAAFKASGKKTKLRKIAVMGCPVNGPGEARDADIGISGTRNGQLVIFRQGKVVCSADYDEALNFFAGELTR